MSEYEGIVFRKSPCTFSSPHRHCYIKQASSDHLLQTSECFQLQILISEQDFTNGDMRRVGLIILGSWELIGITMPAEHKRRKYSKLDFFLSHYASGRGQ